MARAGRRPGQTETQEEILVAARRLFGEKGYQGATIRGIAAEAGVNPALVHHFFRSKEQVFVAAMNFPLNPAATVARLLEGPREDVGRRVVTLILDVWQVPATREPFLALIRSATTNDRAARMLRQFFEHAVLDRVADALGIPKLRMILAFSQMIGLVLSRHVLEVGPLVAARQEELVQLVAPVIQYYLDGGHEV
jgi:AcrR family transcriptional regulator